MCMCVCMYVCACVCVRVFVCICICDDCVQGIFQLFQLQEAYRMKNGMYVYDYLRACDCVCVCVWQMVAHICLIALAAKGLKL